VTTILIGYAAWAAWLLPTTRRSPLSHCGGMGLAAGRIGRADRAVITSHRFKGIVKTEHE
jgi:hypothetical protein